MEGSVRMHKIVPMEDRKYDIIVIGATGFTGSIVTKHLSHHAPNISWAVAGRSRPKLEKLAASLDPLPAGVNVPDILIIDVLTEDEETVREMMEKTRMVINVVGPYSYYGEKVLKPCIRAGTAWVDLNGETPWYGYNLSAKEGHKDMIDKYQSLAEETGAVIVPSCGFDCIPSDLSVYLLHKYAGGPLGNVDAVLEEVKGGYSFGTLSSFVAPYKMYPSSWIVPSTGYLGNPYFLFNTSTSALPTPLPVQPTGTMKKFASKNIFYSGDLAHTSPKAEKHWGGSLTSTNPMEGINRAVVMRSYGLRSTTTKDSYGTQFRYREWVLNPRSGSISRLLFETPLAYFMGYGLPWVMSIPIFRNLIGYGINKLTGEGYGPNKELQENGGFRWKAAAEVVGHVPGNEKAVVRLEGRKDPGYGWTGIILAETALYILGRLRGDDGVVARPGDVDAAPPLQEEVRMVIEKGRAERDDIVFDCGRKGGFWTTAALGVGLVERVVGCGYLEAEIGWVVDEDVDGDGAKGDRKTK
ncbi:Saccharopine dehydrogenase-domain-containing protein [Peziza echinospora]|nr:Saccharopine dehydrogenase-domain-containing protein [Peziza echinospora]